MANTKLPARLLDTSAVPALNVTGNLIVDTTTLKVDASSNRIGIGTASPGSLLTVEGDIRQTTGDFLYGGGGNWDIKHLADDQNILFYTSESGSATEKLRIKASGDIGIGTSSPFNVGGTAKLSVSGSSVLLSMGNSNSDLTYFRRTSAGQYQIQTYNGGNDGSLHLQPYGGNVGIGEISPLGKLHIKGTDVGASPASTANQLVLEDLENGLSILSAPSGAGYINFGDSGDNAKGGFIYDHSADAMRHIANGGEKMRVSSAGNVGIGQNNPQTKLHVTGGFLRVENSGTDAYFFEGVRTGSQTTLRIYDNSNNLYIDSHTNMNFRVNQTGGGSGGTFGFSGSQVGVKGIKQDYIARYTIASGTYTAGTFYEFTNRGTIHNLGYGSGIYQFKVYEDSYAMGGGNYFIHYLFEPWYFVNTGSNAGTVMEFTRSPVSMGHATNGTANRIRIRQVEKYGGVAQGFEWSPGGANVTVTGGSGAVYHIDLFKIA
jgi:hypothetical protein